MTGQQSWWRGHFVWDGASSLLSRVATKYAVRILGLYGDGVGVFEGYTYFRGIKSYRVTVTQVHHYLRTWHFCNLQRQRQRRCRGDYHSFDINPIPAPWMIPTARGRSSSLQDWADGFVGRICKPIHSRGMDGIGHRETQVSLAVHSATHRRLFGREPSPGFWLFLSLPSAEVRHVFFVFGPYLEWRGFLFGRGSEKWRERLMFFF